MRFLLWNTGAHYDGWGQLIGCAMLRDGTVVFVDYSRGIQDHIPVRPPGYMSKAHELRAWVQKAYDGYYYGSTWTAPDDIRKQADVAVALLHKLFIEYREELKDTWRPTVEIHAEPGEDLFLELGRGVRTFRKEDE